MFGTLRGAILTCALAGAVSLATTPAMAVPIQNLPNLVSVTFFERTVAGGADAITFGATSAQMTTQLGGLLSSPNSDFESVVGEFYDVFYSGADGTANPLGEYISVEARYEDPFGFGGGGGHNLAGVRLNFSVGAPQFANSVGSVVAFGLGSFPLTAGNAVDGDLGTHTFLGQTSDASRLRITVGFASAAVPEPVTLALFGIGLAGLGIARRRKAA